MDKAATPKWWRRQAASRYREIVSWCASVNVAHDSTPSTSAMTKCKSPQRRRSEACASSIPQRRLVDSLRRRDERRPPEAHTRDRVAQPCLIDMRHDQLRERALEHRPL